jgi:hypothetical protein
VEVVAEVVRLEILEPPVALKGLRDSVALATAVRSEPA